MGSLFEELEARELAALARVQALDNVHVLLDFVHIAEYVWAAGRLTAILAGHASRTAPDMTARGNWEELPTARRGALDACHRYLTGHLGQLH